MTRVVKLTRKTRARRKPPGKRKGKPQAPPPESLIDRLSEQAMAGDEKAFLALARFHSTFDPIPLSRDLLLRADIEEETRQKLLWHCRRKEDRVLKPFPGVDMVFWGEPWVQDALRSFLWKDRRGKIVPDEAFLKKLWAATHEGAMLQLRILKKTTVTPSAWIRVKHPYYANLGLSEEQMLRIARAEGCRFGREEFFRAARRLRKPS